MKTIFNSLGWLLFAIERLAIRGQGWLDDHYPVSAEEALDDIADCRQLQGRTGTERRLNAHR